MAFAKVAEAAFVGQDAADLKVRPWLRHGAVEHELLDSLGSIEQLADGISFMLADLGEGDRAGGPLDFKMARIQHAKTGRLAASWSCGPMGT
ncbi:MAG: hypothetical protein ACR2LF_11770 [Jatrophihabitantaceae bacterium]